MTSAFKNALVVGLFGVLIVLYSSVFVVDQREVALVVRFGKIVKDIEKPGLYFRIPLVDELIFIEKRAFSFGTNDMAVQVSDGRRYLVDSVTVLRVKDPIRFRETVAASLDRAFDRIKTRLDSALRQTYGRREFGAALSQDRAQMMREIRDLIRPEALALGIEILDVKIRRTDLMPEVLQDTYDRMRAERFSEAAELRAVGQAQAAKIRAEADRQAVELVARARRESEIVRGEGDGNRARIFSQAFEKDPEFFNFYRSMQAYSGALSGKGTTFVLNPKSDFFKYFESEDGVVEK